MAPPVTTGEIRRWKLRRIDGETVARIAADTGRSEVTIRRYLKGSVSRRRACVESAKKTLQERIVARKIERMESRQKNG